MAANAGHATRSANAGLTCTPGYRPCIPNRPSDVDCYGCGGNGPRYTRPGVVYRVWGRDRYGLDADNDGRRRHTLAAVAHECGRDRLPCFGLSACYADLKARTLNGGFDKLTAEQREFVGVGTFRRREGSGGWHEPETTAL